MAGVKAAIATSSSGSPDSARAPPPPCTCPSMKPGSEPRVAEVDPLAGARMAQPGLAGAQGDDPAVAHRDLAVGHPGRSDDPLAAQPQLRRRLVHDCILRHGPGDRGKCHASWVRTRMLWVGPAMAEYSATVTSSRTADQVFEYLSDFSSVSEWDPSITSAHAQRRRRPALGRRDLPRRDQDQRVGGRARLRDARARAPGRIVLRGENDSMISLDTITIASQGRRRLRGHLRGRARAQGRAQARRSRCSSSASSASATRPGTAWPPSSTRSSLVSPGGRRGGPGAHRRRGGEARRGRIGSGPGGDRRQTERARGPRRQACCRRARRAPRRAGRRPPARRRPRPPRPPGGHRQR